jgi:hypothetical protein
MDLKISLDRSRGVPAGIDISALEGQITEELKGINSEVKTDRTAAGPGTLGDISHLTWIVQHLHQMSPDINILINCIRAINVAAQALSFVKKDESKKARTATRIDNSPRLSFKFTSDNGNVIAEGEFPISEAQFKSLQTELLGKPSQHSKEIHSPTKIKD